MNGIGIKSNNNNKKTVDIQSNGSKIKFLSMLSSRENGCVNGIKLKSICEKQWPKECTKMKNLRLKRKKKIENVILTFSLLNLSCWKCMLRFEKMLLVFFSIFFLLSTILSLVQSSITLSPQCPKLLKVYTFSTLRPFLHSPTMHSCFARICYVSLSVCMLTNTKYFLFLSHSMLTHATES